MLSESWGIVVVRASWPGHPTIIKKKRIVYAYANVCTSISLLSFFYFLFYFIGALNVILTLEMNSSKLIFVLGSRVNLEFGSKSVTALPLHYE
jgi:hypothetical protein